MSTENRLLFQDLTAWFSNSVSRKRKSMWSKYVTNNLKLENCCIVPYFIMLPTSVDYFYNCAGDMLAELLN
jgi:hypothetical protein